MNELWIDELWQHKHDENFSMPLFCLKPKLKQTIEDHGLIKLSARLDKNRLGREDPEKKIGTGLLCIHEVVDIDQVV